MTQDLYQKALKFAGEKHRNQLVPGTNANYLLHLSNVAMEIFMAHAAADDFDLNFAIQLAVLHDTLEDTDTSFEELKENFGERIAMGVFALTKNSELSSKSEKMTDSLRRINELEKEVGIVKLADRITNLQEPPVFWNQEKRERYQKEATLINEILNEKNGYLNKRLKEKIAMYHQFTKS